MTRRNSALRGFSIMQMLVALALLAIFAVVASRVFYVTMVTFRQSPLDKTASASAAQALAALADELTDARALAIDSPAVLRVTGAVTVWLPVRTCITAPVTPPSSLSPCEPPTVTEAGVSKMT
jgi:Tfp pilus assembly protein FimT